jgi:hypothetical protein
MVICPIALAVHCTGCPLVKFCPLKTVLGDYGKGSPVLNEEQASNADDKNTTPDKSADQ